MRVHVKSWVIHSKQTGKVFTSYAMKASTGKREFHSALELSCQFDAPTDLPPAKYSYTHRTGCSVDFGDDPDG